VARKAIDGLEHDRRTVIPGTFNKFNAVSGRHTPRGLFLSLARRYWPS
jgi:short-subunit dehydrogenase